MGVRNNWVLRDSVWCLEVLDKPSSAPGFYPLGKIGVLQGLLQWIMRPWALKSSIMGFTPWRAFLLIDYWLILESLEGSIWILMGGTLWIFPVSVWDLALKEGGSWFIRDKQLVFPESAPVVLDTEQIKDVKRSFHLPGWLFWWLLSNSRIISSFGEKEILV